MAAWEPSEILVVKKLIQEGKSIEQILSEIAQAGMRRRTYDGVRNMIRRHRRTESGWHALVDPNPTCAPRWDRPLKVTADRVLLMFDIHCPMHDADWCNQLIDLALTYNVDTVGIGGDLVDFTAFSKYGRQERVEAEDEVASSRQLVSALATTFDRVIYSGGNHEMRLPRATENVLALRDTMEMLVKGSHVEVTDYHWFELTSGGERFYCEHPKPASTKATIVPEGLATKYLCHIIAGHGHVWGIKRHLSNQFWCVDSGVCADPKRLAYTSKVHNTRPLEVQGAVFILDGIPILLSPDNIAFYKQNMPKAP